MLNIILYLISLFAHIGYNPIEQHNILTIQLNVQLCICVVYRHVHTVFINISICLMMYFRLFLSHIIFSYHTLKYCIVKFFTLDCILPCRLSAFSASSTSDSAFSKNMSIWLNIAIDAISKSELSIKSSLVLYFNKSGCNSLYSGCFSKSLKIFNNNGYVIKNI